MKFPAFAVLLAMLSACGTPNFIADAPPIEITQTTPDHFELPARIGVARLVYGRLEPAGAQEMALWEDLGTRASGMGTFLPLQSVGMPRNTRASLGMIEAARAQRCDYLLVVAMSPQTGGADISVMHVGSGGVMATSRAVTAQSGQRGFWGGQINNPARLDRVTLRIARAAVPEVEEVLRGMVARQN